MLRHIILCFNWWRIRRLQEERDSINRSILECINTKTMLIERIRNSEKPKSEVPRIRGIDEDIRNLLRKEQNIKEKLKACQHSQVA